MRFAPPSIPPADSPLFRCIIRDIYGVFRMSAEDNSKSSQDFIVILKCAYATIHTRDERLALMFLLHHEIGFSARAISLSIGEIIGVYYLDIIGEVYEIMENTYYPAEDTKSALTSKLKECGLQDWIVEHDWKNHTSNWR
jgi:hypothetical protein